MSGPIKVGECQNSFLPTNAPFIKHFVCLKKVHLLVKRNFDVIKIHGTRIKK